MRPWHAAKKEKQGFEVDRALWNSIHAQLALEKERACK